MMLAIIPARGGSKRLSGKNIKILNGKPLIAWTIEAAKKSQFITRLVCSTDTSEIAEVAKKNGAEIPFMRPKKLATDTAKAIDNYIFTIEELKKRENNIYKDFVVLQPTSPLRKANDIDKAIDLFREKDAESVISYSEALHPPVWAKRIDNNKKIKNYFQEDVSNKNRQKIPIAYMPNGAIFVFRYSLLKNKYTYYSDETYAYVMPNERSIDIDNLIDFEFAEFIMRRESEKH